MPAEIAGPQGVCRFGFFRFPALIKPEAFAVHFQYMDVMSEPIEQSPRQTLCAEGFRPFFERQVGRDHDGTTLIALRDDLEQQFRAGF